jgi:hypothetical protein
LQAFSDTTFIVFITVAQLCRTLERAQAYALPGHEAVERDSVLRELHRLLGLDRERRHRPVLRLVNAGALRPKWSCNKWLLAMRGIF